MKKIQLHGRHGEGRFTLVDDDDYWWLNTFRFTLPKPDGYAMTCIHSKNVLLHLMLNPRRNGLETDHVNRDKLDNRRANLCYTTRSENVRNTLRSDCESRIRGVCYYAQYKRPWQAHCSFAGHYYHLGSFLKKESAAKAYVDFLDEVRELPEKAREIAKKMQQRGWDESGRSRPNYK